MPLSELRLQPIITGLLSFIPGAYGTLYKAVGGGGGGTGSAQYCYDTWLTHLAVARAAGWRGTPKRVAELGPGLSLGAGLAALLSGSDTFVALDVVPYSHSERNLEVLEGLVALFEREALISNLPDFAPVAAKVDAANLSKAVRSAGRLGQLRNELKLLRGSKGNAPHITYSAPWTDLGILPANSVDLLFSNAVYEHVDDIDFVNRAVFHWLAPGGVAIHRVDFGCHGTARSWNGHWSIPSPLWRIIRGKRPYSISRNTPDAHRASFIAAGFKILKEFPQIVSSSLERGALAAEFRNVSDDGLKTRQAFFVLERP